MRTQPGGKVRELTRAAQDVFATPAEMMKVELHFEADGMEPAIVQLRKGCRSLTFLRTSVDEDEAAGGFYTVWIEAGFHAIERSIFALLLALGKINMWPSDHSYTWKNGHLAALWTPEVSKELSTLYETVRNDFYYRNERATSEQAKAILALAIEIHRRAAGDNRLSGGCVCDE